METAPAPSPSGSHRAIAVWLFVMCALVFGMVVLGGVTRLTGSGLSMVNWAPIMGWLPPLNQAEWMAAFTAYQASPEFNLINIGMDLEGFKGIFWLEFLHRLLGRTIGLAFLLPFLWFLIRGKIERGMAPKFFFMFILGGLQGVLGWYMVKSGLVKNPHVSQYRLTAHLLAAFAIFAYMFWVGLGLWFKGRAPIRGIDHRGLARLARLVTWTIVVTVTSGGFVAGLKAGLAFNTFPLMNGRLVPDGFLMFTPAWRNFFENIATVQWDHRFLALLLSLLILWLWRRSRSFDLPREARLGINLMLGMWLIQISLGITTLLFYVPVPLASAHQAGAVVLFALGLFVNFHLRTDPEEAHESFSRSSRLSVGG